MTINNYIEKLGLLPHPEGGYYRQLYGNDATGKKDISTMKQGFCLVGCAVGPAFSFENFELAKKSNLLQLYPQHKELIERLTKE